MPPRPDSDDEEGQQRRASAPEKSVWCSDNSGLLIVSSLFGPHPVRRMVSQPTDPLGIEMPVVAHGPRGTARGWSTRSPGRRSRHGPVRSCRTRLRHGTARCGWSARSGRTPRRAAPGRDAASAPRALVCRDHGVGSPCWSPVRRGPACRKPPPEQTPPQWRTPGVAAPSSPVSDRRPDRTASPRHQRRPPSRRLQPLFRTLSQIDRLIRVGDPSPSAPRHQTSTRIYPGPRWRRAPTRIQTMK